MIQNNYRTGAFKDRVKYKLGCIRLILNNSKDSLNKLEMGLKSLEGEINDLECLAVRCGLNKFSVASLSDITRERVSGERLILFQTYEKSLENLLEGIDESSETVSVSEDVVRLLRITPSERSVWEQVECNLGRAQWAVDWMKKYLNRAKVHIE